MTAPADVSEIPAFILRNDKRLASEICARLLAEIPTRKPSDWLAGERQIILRTPFAKGVPWSFEGRQYMREMIDDIDDPAVLFQTVCAGTGSGKTNKDLGQILWILLNNPSSGLYVMPAQDGPGGATNLNNGSIIPTMEESPAFAGKLPTGMARHGVSGTKIRFGGNDFDFVGANSAAQVKNKRCQFVFLGEQDAYKENLGREGGTDSLAAERTKGMAASKIMRGSTPSAEDVGIWPHLMGAGDETGSDCRRRLLPCPHCNRPADGRISPLAVKGWMVLVKDQELSVLPKHTHAGLAIPAAALVWDKEVKRLDGSTDVDRLVRSARFECPHCGGHVTDEHRIWQDANGIWVPTRKGSRGHRGYHLPSFYAPWVQREFKSSYGGMALKFFENSQAGTMKAYINSELAEVHVNQESSDRSRIEIESRPAEPSSAVKLKLISVDNQQLFPSKWLVVREFVARVLRPARTFEEQVKFLNELSGPEQTISENLTGTLLPEKDATPAHLITYDIQRTEHWPRICEWLLAKDLTGERLAGFFAADFQNDLVRLLEHVCKEIGIKLGRQGDSESVEIGSADSWEEIEECQERHGIPNSDVIIDARFGSMDNQEVFAECFRRCPAAGFAYFLPFGAGGKFFGAPVQGAKPFAMAGWTPIMGFPEHKVWANRDKIRLPYGEVVDDPFKGTSQARSAFQYVFQFDAQWALSELSRIRKKNHWGIAHGCKFTGVNSKMLAVALDEYNLHMKGYYWDAKDQKWLAPGKAGGSQSKRHPNHLYDCEKNALARAVWKGIFKYQRRELNSK